MKRLPLLAVTLVAAGLLNACDSVKAPHAVTPDPVSQTQYPQIAAQGKLKGLLSYTKPTVRRGPDAPLSVTVPVRLRDDKPYNVQYRFVFFDELDRPLRPQMDWRYMVLPPRLQAFMEGSALSPEVVDWRLEIRPAK